MRNLQRHLPFLLIVNFLFTATMAIAKDYIIYSIGHELPMGLQGEKVRKNFYVNLGSNQGVEKGSVLDIYRQETKHDPYESKQKYNYKFKIGELKIIHTDENAAIATLNNFINDEDQPIMEIKAPMIGDKVNVKVD